MKTNTRKIAFITGSSNGIGLAIASTLAASGLEIVTHGMESPEEVANKREKLMHDYSVPVHYFQSDFSKPNEIKSTLMQVQENIGNIDILVNNAGIQRVAPLEQFSIEDWDKVIALNLSAVFHTSRLVLPHMREKNWGRIINIASAHGLVASIHKSAYVASKHGVLGLTKVIALETATTGITVNAICPGWVNTPLVQQQIQRISQEKNLTLDEAQQQLLKEKQPSHTFIEPESIGALVLFLCSENASQVRGATWTIDGGWTAQ